MARFEHGNDALARMTFGDGDQMRLGRTREGGFPSRGDALPHGG
jgi:hypothetical protein